MSQLVHYTSSSEIKSRAAAFLGPSRARMSGQIALAIIVDGEKKGTFSEESPVQTHSWEWTNKRDGIQIYTWTGESTDLRVYAIMFSVLTEVKYQRTKQKRNRSRFLLVKSGISITTRNNKQPDGTQTGGKKIIGAGCSLEVCHGEDGGWRWEEIIGD